MAGPTTCPSSHPDPSHDASFLTQPSFDHVRELRHCRWPASCILNAAHTACAINTKYFQLEGIETAILVLQNTNQQ